MSLDNDQHLLPCPICGEPARYVKRGYFHLSFAFVEGDEVEYNFFADRAIQCSGCNLTMPEMDPDHPGELDDSWNHREAAP